jgi:hypothetical protein
MELLLSSYFQPSASICHLPPATCHSNPDNGPASVITIVAWEPQFSQSARMLLRRHFSNDGWTQSVSRCATGRGIPPQTSHPYSNNNIYSYESQEYKLKQAVVWFFQYTVVFVYVYVWEFIQFWWHITDVVWCARHRRQTLCTTRM